MTMLWIIAAIVVLLVVWTRFDAWRRSRAIEQAFSGRQALDSEQFYERYFKATGVPFHIVHGVRTVLEQQLAADMSRLTDADDFSSNLSFFWDFDSMADVEIVCALEEKFGIEISNEDAKGAVTVNDIVNLVYSKTLPVYFQNDGFMFTTKDTKIANSCKSLR